jgi:hypothetical protein
MEKKVHDFQKAIEQKQKREENKETLKFQPKYTLKQFEEAMEEHRKSPLGIQQAQEMAETVLQPYKELSEKYNQACDLIQRNHENFNKLHDMFEKVYIKGDRDSYLISLFEHFISEKEMEDEFFEFLKGVAENEPVEEYKNAAQWKVDFSKFEYEGQVSYHLDCEYGATIDGREFDDEEMEVAN